MGMNMEGDKLDTGKNEAQSTLVLVVQRAGAKEEVKMRRQELNLVSFKKKKKLALSRGVIHFSR
jgi:hypothetical protein